MTLRITHEEFGAITVYLYDGEISFGAKEVAKALNFQSMMDAVQSYVSNENQYYIYRGTQFGENAILVLTLAGVKELCDASNLKQANGFYTWASKEPEKRLKEKAKYEAELYGLQIGPENRVIPEPERKFWMPCGIGILVGVVIVIVFRVISAG